MPNPNSDWVSLSALNLAGWTFFLPPPRNVVPTPSIRLRCVASGFNPGESFHDENGQTQVVETVEQRDNLLVYLCGGQEFSESRLSRTDSLTSVPSLLRAGKSDPDAWFRLRTSALELRHHLRASPVEGYLGAKIELVPHPAVYRFGSVRPACTPCAAGGMRLAWEKPSRLA